MAQRGVKNVTILQRPLIPQQPTAPLPLKEASYSATGYVYLEKVYHITSQNLYAPHSLSPPSPTGTFSQILQTMDSTSQKNSLSQMVETFLI